MSGSTRAVTLQLSIRDATKLRDDLISMGDAGAKALERLDAAAARASQSTQTSARSFDQLRVANDNAMRSMGGGTQIITSAGFQMQDFAVQVQGGTSAMTAFAQQAPQFLGAFGPGGAIAGAVVAVGVLLANLLLLNDATKKQAEESERVQRATDAARLAQEAYTRQTETATEAANRAARAKQEEARQAAGLAIAIERSTQAELNAAATRAMGVRERLEASVTAGRAAPEQVSGGLTRARETAAGLASLMEQSSARLATFESQLAELNRNEVGARDRLAQRDEGLATGHIETWLKAEQTREENERKARERGEARDASRHQRDLEREAELQRKREEGATLATSHIETWTRAQTEASERAQRARQQSDDRARQDSERELNRMSSRWGNRMGDAVADAIFDGAKRGESALEQLANVFKAGLKGAIAGALSNAVFTPMATSFFSSLGFGTAAGAGGLARMAFGSGAQGLGAAGIGATMGNGGAVNWAAMPSPFSLGSDGIAGSMLSSFMPQGVTNFLNTPIATGYNAANTGMVVGGVENMGAAGGATYGQALGAGASIVGGAYGIYSGIQRGGIGGGVQAAGGAVGMAGGVAGAAGLLGASSPILASMAVYAPYLAAALLVASMFLPGQKPSNKAGLATLNLGTDAIDIGGQTGDKFDQGNRDTARGMVESVLRLSDSLETLTGTKFTDQMKIAVEVGSRDGVKAWFGGQDTGHMGTFERSEEGAATLVKEATAYLFRAMMGNMQDLTLQQVVGKNIQRDSANEVFFQDIEWYNNVYKPLSEAYKPANEFAQALEAMQKPFFDAIHKATDLGIATEGLADRMTLATDKLTTQRNQQVSDFITGIDARYARATGQTKAGALLDFDVNARQQIRDARTFLESRGVGEEIIIGVIASLEKTLAEERIDVLEQFGTDVLAVDSSINQARLRALQTLQSQQNILLGFLNDNALNSPLASPASRLAEAQRQFGASTNAARDAGPGKADLNAVVQSANALISAGVDYYATGPDAVNLQNMVRSTVQSLGAQLDLPAFGGSLESGITRATEPLVTGLDALSAEITRLTNELQTTRLQGLAA